MAEKILNTRIGLKIDTLEAWNASTIVLKKGEPAFATVAASAGTGLTEPVVMIKVGDGSKTFSQLAWNFHAKASDVLAACKSEEALTAFVNTVITNANLATSETVSGIETRLQTAEGEIDGLQALVGDTAVATQITNAISALNLATTYEAKGAAAQALTDAKAYTDDLAKGAVKTNTDAIAAIKEGATIVTFKGVETALEGKEAAGAAAQALADAKSYADGKVASVSATDASIAVAGTATAPTVSVKLSQVAGNDLSVKDDGLYVSAPVADKYSLVKEEGTSDYAAVYHLTKNGTNEGVAINIPKDMVLQSGAVEENPEGQAPGTYLVLTLANATNDKIYVNVGSLIEYVTSGSADGDMVVVAVSEDHKVTATITDGTITKAKLHADVQTTLNKADSALQKASIAEGTENGTISVGGSNVSVHGLGTAAYAATGDFDASGAAATAKSEVIGTAEDAASADTIKGAKKYAEAEAAKYANKIETVKVNGTALTPDASKAVDIAVPTGALAAKDKVAEADLETELATKINGKANDADLATIAKSGNVNDLVQAEGDVLVFNCGTASTVI